MKQVNKKRTIIKRILIGIGIVFVCAFLFMMGGGLWFASNQLLSPVWKGVEKDLGVCKPETEKAFGEECGNLRTTKQYQFSEVQIPSSDGYSLPGWLIKAEENGKGTAKGAIMLVHSGGSDRREQTKLIRFFLNQQIDVLTFDYACHGEAPCPIAGLTYGSRESKDVLAAYNYLKANYETIYSMGTSVGAAAVLIALPEMPELSAVIVDSGLANFERLIKEAPEAQSAPEFFVTGMIKLAMIRGQFDMHPSPEESLRLVDTTPILFIHSKADKTASYKHSEDMAKLYKGPKTVWFPEKGSHAEIWTADPVTYEKHLEDFLTYTQ